MRRRRVVFRVGVERLLRCPGQRIRLVQVLLLGLQVLQQARLVLEVPVVEATMQPSILLLQTEYVRHNDRLGCFEVGSRLRRLNEALEVQNG